MHQVQLSERVYKEAKRQAAEAGYPSIDDYISDVLMEEGLENDQNLFPPERLARIDKLVAELDAGAKTYGRGVSGNSLKRIQRVYRQLND